MCCLYILLTNKPIFNIWGDEIADSATRASQNRSKQPTQKVPMVGFFTLPLKMKRDPASPNQE